MKASFRGRGKAQSLIMKNHGRRQQWASLDSGGSWALRLVIQMSLQLEMTPLAQCSLQGTLDLCVPQAVDQWVQHGFEKAVKLGRDLPLVLGGVIWGPWTWRWRCQSRAWQHRGERSRWRRPSWGSPHTGSSGWHRGCTWRTPALGTGAPEE